MVTPAAGNHMHPSNPVRGHHAATLPNGGKKALGTSRFDFWGIPHQTVDGSRTCAQF